MVKKKILEKEPRLKLQHNIMHLYQYGYFEEFQDNYTLADYNINDQSSLKYRCIANNYNENLGENNSLNCW